MLKKGLRRERRLQKKRGLSEGEASQRESDERSLAKEESYQRQGSNT